jgi:P-type Ca2+ transporter type 2C
MNNPHTLLLKEIYASLKTNKDGLSSDNVKTLKKEYGRNVLSKGDDDSSRFKIFLDQWKSPLIFMLIFAGAVSGFLGDYSDMAIIFFTALFNIFIGFFQEDKANNALKKMRSLVTYKAVVLRDGKKQIVASEDIVPGDVLVLDAGDKVQADGRIIELTELEVNESVLTGESEPIKKDLKVYKEDTSLGDRRNMVYRGTTVVSGHSLLIVTAIGDNTEIGKIATLVSETVDEKTPLQVELAELSKIIGLIVLLIAVGVFALGFLLPREGTDLVLLFETSVALAVAAIPEGLVISLTVILAIGMQFILKRNALVRKLVSAETLGSVSVICTDKTGTLTEGNMAIDMLVTDGINTFADILRNKKLSIAEKKILEIGILANDGMLEHTDEEKKWALRGDTTDTAILEAGALMGMFKEQFEKETPRINDVPFDSKRKFIATLHRAGKGDLMLVKGAPEILYKRVTHCFEKGKVKKCTSKKLKWFQDQEEMLTGEGKRVIALAYKEVKGATVTFGEKDVENLVFVGLIALSDPVRSDVKQSLALAQKAGIHVVMITGDHARTAQSIARDLGLPHDDSQILTGIQLADMNAAELELAVKHVTIFARVNPKDKIDIVRAFQAIGEQVAMTGDGVNDAPALKGADIGIAPGSGTDVAKEVADLVLLDDSFSTIVYAVEEGRTIYQNIKKVVLYLLSGSFAEVIMVTGTILAGFPLPALPAQILWINIVEDAFPNMALAFDRGDKENMHDPPRKRTDRLIDPEMRIMIILKAIVANIILFALFVYFFKTTGDIVLTRTIVFVGFGIDALFYIFSIRSLRHPIWKMPLLDNTYLLGAVAFGWVMLISAVHLPILQTLLHTVPLDWHHWVIMIGFGLSNVVLIEIIKHVFIIRKHRYATS